MRKVGSRGWRTSMSFKPNRAYYRTTWDERPDRVYRAAPQSARDSISSTA